MGTEEVSPTPEVVPAANGDGSKISDVENKIIRQIEYYFGDYNYCRDKFLKNEASQNDGWIPLEIMIKFNRLKQISEDFAVITAALKKSPNELVEVNEEGTQIRRSPLKPLPDYTDEKRTEVESRSIYAKGFKADSTLDELLEFFKTFGNVENILMRRNKLGKRKFKGSVFVTFNTPDDAKKFIEEKSVEYKGSGLLREYKKDYLARKEVEYQERRKEMEEKKAKKALDIAKVEGDTKEEESKEPNPEANFTKGCLLKLTGLIEGTMREDIKPILEPHGTIAYVDFYKGDVEGVIRFESPVAAEVLEKVSKEVDGNRKIEIRNVECPAFVLEGDDEAKYYVNMKKNKFRQFKMNKRGGGRHNRGGYGKQRRGGFGKGRDNKRKFDDDDQNEDGESSKKIKKDDSTDVITADNSKISEKLTE